MTTWFQGTSEIACAIRKVGDAYGDPGNLYVAVVGLMPGMTSVELVDQGPDWVTIKTNEGLMKRTGLVTDIADGSVVVEFDEEYQAGSRVTFTSHHRSEFAPSAGGVTHDLVISDLVAPGLLGFFYRRFGRSKMGKAFMDSHRAHFETA
jgi:hypothetical protein